MNDPKDPGTYCCLCKNCEPPLALTGRTAYGFGTYKCIWCINDISMWNRYKRRSETHYSSVHDRRVSKTYPFGKEDNKEFWRQYKITQFA